MKEDYIPSFSKIIKNPYESDKIKRCRPDYSPVGFEIYKQFKNWNDIFPQISLLQYVIMPDHLHFLVKIEEKLEDPLGVHLAKFKKNIDANCKAKNLIASDETIYSFKPGFNDQFLRHDRNLNTFYDYIKANPFRYRERWDKPEFFRRIQEDIIVGEKCSLYGNRFLLDHPCIYPVIIHRSDIKNPNLLRQKKEIWEYAILNGGVIVGGFISKAEKEIRDMAYTEGGKVIYLRQEAFQPREKPSKKDFEQCEKGNLLMITPLELIRDSNSAFEWKCHYNNAFAERIANIHKI